MGFWSFFFDSEYKRRRDIDQQGVALDYANSEVRRLNEQVRLLRTELHKMRKGHKAMLKVLIEHGLTTEENFSERVGATRVEVSRASSMDDDAVYDTSFKNPRRNATKGQPNSQDYDWFSRG